MIFFSMDDELYPKATKTDDPLVRGYYFLLRPPVKVGEDYTSAITESGTAMSRDLRLSSRQFTTVFDRSFQRRRR